MAWSELGEWWLTEVDADEAYDSVVTPMLLDTLRPAERHTYLDLGSGEGRVIRAVAEAGAAAHGVEVNEKLARRSNRAGPTLIADLTDLRLIRAGSYDGAYCVLALEHIADHELFFRQVADAVRANGVLAVVMNHPMWTAPGSTPMTDSHGEVLWRPGRYFSSGSSEEPAGDRTVTFHHRSMASLLNAAARARWSLESVLETPHHELEDQKDIPRLLACRWSLLP